MLMISRLPVSRCAVRAVALAVAIASASVAFAVDPVTPSNQMFIYNPNWNISLTDSGYSDFLLDATPGFEGREYLSGEWAAAVGYKVGGTTYKPVWMEPNFIFPDWRTNSNFTTVTPITATAFMADGVTPTAAQSVIANTHLQITIDSKMVDTITGMKIGTSRASAGTGSSIDSNRYALVQTYTIKNISDDDVTNLNLFQFLHSLEGSSTLYDNRSYLSNANNTATLDAYRYDTTQVGVSTASSNSNSFTSTFKDYISFGSAVLPFRVDSSWYGSNDPNSPIYTDHIVGKPGIDPNTGLLKTVDGVPVDPGTHLHIEADALNNADYFAPAGDLNKYVGGAQQYTLGSLNRGDSVSFDVVLSIRTGTVADVNTEDNSCSGKANGGSYVAGGVDFHIHDLTGPVGAFYAEYATPDANELRERIEEGEFGEPDFSIPGTMQLFLLEYEGEHDGDITLTFGYDPTLLDGLDESALAVYHYKNGAWENLGGIIDALNHTITVTTSSLSPFALGEAAPVPEPASLCVLGLGGLALLRRRR